MAEINELGFELFLHTTIFRIWSLATTPYSQNSKKNYAIKLNAKEQLRKRIIKSKFKCFSLKRAQLRNMSIIKVFLWDIFYEGYVGSTSDIQFLDLIVSFAGIKSFYYYLLYFLYFSIFWHFYWEFSIIWLNRPNWLSRPTTDYRLNLEFRLSHFCMKLNVYW